MDLDVHVAAATFSDGTEIELSASAVRFVVGANNSGKSRTLAELRELLSGAPPGLVLRAVRRGGGADGQTITQWLDEVAYVTRDANGSPTSWSVPPLGAMPLYDFSAIKSQVSADGPLGTATQLLVQTLGVGDRQTLTAPQASFDRVQAQPATPLQALQADPALEKDLSETAVTAFGKPVTLNRVAGPNLRLHVGRPHRAPDLMSVEYAEELAALPSVEEQGDGYKAFLGVMLSVLVGRARILLIDEPETFLHPPQARRLGREISSRTEHGTQVICATHSADVLEGALQGDGA